MRGLATKLFLFIVAILISGCSAHISEVNRKTQEPKLSNNHFVTSDGSALPYLMWGPRTKPKSIILGIHSFGDFSKAYELIGKYFASRGVALWTYDQRGFGASPNKGIWAGTQTLVQDMEEFAVLVQKTAGQEVPIVMLGESMGAAVILAALGKDKTAINPKSIILSGPAVREDRPYRYLFNIGLWGVTKILPRKEVEILRTYDERLAPFHAERWALDERIIDSVRLDTYYGLIRLSDFASGKAKRLDVPTLLLFGTEDSQIHPKSICALMTALNSQSKLKVYEDKPHLIFQIKNQARLLSDIWDWVNQREYREIPSENNFCTSAL
jgi:acylglycerol lipase